jgi:hypothetical protein
VRERVKKGIANLAGANRSSEIVTAMDSKAKESGAGKIAEVVIHQVSIVNVLCEAFC